VKHISATLAIFALLLSASCVGTPKPTATEESGISLFAASLDKAIFAKENTVSFVYLTEFGGKENNQLLIEYVTGQIKKSSKARFFDRSSMDQILEERNFAYQGFMDDDKIKYLAEFWPSTYIMTGMYAYSSGSLSLKLKVVDIVTAELVLSDTIFVPMAEDAWKGLDAKAAAEAAAAAALKKKVAMKQEAMNKYRARDYMGAIPSLSAYDARFPGDLETLAALSDCYRGIGQRPESAKWALAYEMANPGSYDAYVMLGHAYSWYDHQKSIDNFLKAFAIRNSDQWALWTLACQYDQIGDKNKAYEYYQKAYERAKVNKDTASVAGYEKEMARVKQ